MKIKPLQGFVLLEAVKEEQATIGGIILPDGVKQQPDQAKVIAVGDDKSPVKVNDVVIYKKWGGEDIKLDGKEFKLIKYEDLIAIMG